VLVGYQDDAATKFTSSCAEALQMIGGKEPFQREFRGSYALVGYKGKPAEPFISQQKQSKAGEGPTNLEGTYP